MALAVVCPSDEKVRLAQITSVTSLSGSWPRKEVRPGRVGARDDASGVAVGPVQVAVSVAKTGDA